MCPADLVRLVWGNLRRMKGRVALTAVGVVIGTTSLVVLVSLGAGLQRLSTDFTSGSPLTEIHLNPHTHYRIVQGAELAGMVSDAPATRCGSRMDDLPVVDSAMRDRFAALPGVSWVGVYETLLGTSDIIYGNLRGYAIARGVELDLFRRLDLEVARGTTDMQRGEVVIGAGFAASLFDPVQRARGLPAGQGAPPPDLLGERLTLQLTTLSADGTLVQRSIHVRVVGVLAPKGWMYDEGLFLPERDVIELNNWIHARRAGQRRDPARQGYTGVVVKVGDLSEVAAVEEALYALGFPVYTERRQLEEWASFFTTLQVFLGGIGAISLLVAAFGIANTMGMAVHERTREIGLMKALGASNRAVLAVFLTESAGIGVAGGLGGIALGFGLILLLNLRGSTGIAGLPAAKAVAPLWLPFFAVLFAGFIGVLSGTYPARRAAGLVPLVALKFE
jgi:putative ABC transport system permease protein